MMEHPEVQDEYKKLKDDKQKNTEDLEDIYYAEKTLADIKAGRERVLSSEEFWDDLDD